LAVHAIREDREGNLWVGGSTILKFRGSDCKEYHLEGYGSASRVKSIVETADGSVLVGTVSGLQLFPHWNWKGREGTFLPVTCYTNCDSVELFLNGRSVGTKGYAFPRYGMQGRYGQYAPAPAGAVRTTNDLHLTWDVPFETGTLKAVGMKGGKVAVEVEISTTGDPAALSLSVDRDVLRAGRRDVALITAKVLDAQGRVHPEADNTIAFEVQGQGRLIGVDNGNLADLSADFKGKTVKAFHGLCLAMVQSTGATGQIQLTATSPGLKTATINIAAKA
jgi:beta-galactosidase